MLAQAIYFNSCLVENTKNKTAFQKMPNKSIRSCKLKPFGHLMGPLLMDFELESVFSNGAKNNKGCFSGIMLSFNRLVVHAVSIFYVESIFLIDEIYI